MGRFRKLNDPFYQIIIEELYVKPTLIAAYSMGRNLSSTQTKE